MINQKTRSFIDPKTGFTSPLNTYITAFSPDRKQKFIDLYFKNSCKFQNTCDQLGLNYHTVWNAFKNDSTFNDKMQESERRYLEQLEDISRVNALHPKSVVERMFQLRSLKPSIYARDNNNKDNNSVNVVVIPIEEIKKMQERERSFNGDKFLDVKENKDNV